MSILMKKLTELANSPQGRRLTDKAQQFANDPKTKEQVEKAKLKIAELRTGAGKRGADDPTPTQPHADDPPPGGGPHAA